MYGGGVGSLQVLVTRENSSPREVWIKRENQGSDWHKAEIDIDMGTAYSQVNAYSLLDTYVHAYMYFYFN